ncbi:MAG: Gfo/Idh/MocA family oxidoreductase [Cyanobacteria bacterium SID2]|nr:Gfo/Idh/MocA family oxidoreductase [Cyanobacteria bacterium SID2]MBP0003640.1 Gfo/Idh/MocA family oxidoreductase [Cyanobacteria bacterium SBC]
MLQTVPIERLRPPVRVGIVGTGFVAKRRAEVFENDPKARLVAVSGRSPESTREFAATYNVEVTESWQALVDRADLDVIVLCGINLDRGLRARTALERGKHVVAEYPLALDPEEARSILSLARTTGRLLHVEHIELLGGLHRAIFESLPQIQPVSYARYATFKSKRPAPRDWSYHHHWFGFPFIGALSRFHRLVDCFGNVRRVNARSRFWDVPESDYYTACLCQAQLEFTNGVLAEVVYGKGDRFGSNSTAFEIRGENGTLLFDRQGGQLIRGDEVQSIEIGTRRGAFAKDTQMVLDRLLDGTPLYVNPEASLYTLKVADAARESAETRRSIDLTA